MISAKSFTGLSLALSTLLFSVGLPLTAYAATEVSISSSGGGTNTITVNGQTFTSNTPSGTTSTTVHISNETTSPTSTPSKTALEITPPPTGTNSTEIQNTPTPTPRLRLRLLRTPTPTPTKAFTPTPTRKPSPTPTNTPTPIAGASAMEEKQAYIMNAINDYRKSQGLSPVKTDQYTCDFAKIRAQEITKGFNHDGFQQRIVNNALPYPSYHLVTENIAMTSDYKKVVTLWINSPSHAENMRRDTPYVCVESSGNYYAYEGWKP